MSCCGQKRAAIRTRTGADAYREAAAAPPSPPAVEAGGAEDVVEYRGDHPILVAVPGGRLYSFSPGRRTAFVPAADVDELLRHPLFRLERRSHGTRQEGP